MKNRLIVVLGMHRSGTSAITRGLQVMGVGLGDRLMPPMEGINPKGFWEDIDFNALNISMLSALGSDWHRLAFINSDEIDMLHKKDYFPRAVELLRQKVDNTLIFGFKDPRVVKLLPFWKDVISHCELDVSYVLVVRHPLSVTKSLAMRDGFDPEKSYLLWLRHNITSLAGTAGDKRVLVDFDCLIQSPDHELNRIAKNLNLEIDPQDLQIYKTEFLDERLRHTVYNLNDLLLDNTCPPFVRDVYAVLLDLASDNINLDNIMLQNKVVQWASELERFESILKLLDRLFIQKVVAAQALTEKDAELSRIINSKTWKLALFFRRIHVLLFPQKNRDQGIMSR